MTSLVESLLRDFGRGGGGGSGGGGGGGGGGGFGGGGFSGSSSGGTPLDPISAAIVSAIFAGVFGFVATAFTLPVLSYFFPGMRKTMRYVFAIVFTITLAGLLLLISWPTGFALACGVLIGGVGGIIFGSKTTINTGRKPKLRTVGHVDASVVIAEANDVFTKYQAAWSSSDITTIRSITTDQFGEQTTLLLEALALLHRKNNMDAVRIKRSQVIDADADGTGCTVLFVASSKDTLIDNDTGKVLFTDSSSFTEYWRFKKQGDVWLLDHIDEETADLGTQRSDMVRFAIENNMHYCLDMGWLFLPSRGKLFGKGKFGVSDINNYVVGKWGSYLVQFYTYKAYGSSGNPIVISQLAVPKSYGGILIQPKKLFGNGAPNGYTKYEFEWPDFNQRYTVYATDPDRLATFELLNPGFMAYLYDTDEHVSIEVVDTIIYLYKTGSDQTIDYQTVLTILQRAYKELQL